MNFNDRLLDLRKKKGWSQEELGDKLDVSRQTISKWEAGQTTPELEKLRKLARLFEISVDELIMDDEIVEEKDNCDNNRNIDKKVKLKNGKKTIKRILFVVTYILIILTIWYGLVVFKRVKTLEEVAKILPQICEETSYMEINKCNNTDNNIEWDYKRFYKYEDETQYLEKVDVYMSELAEGIEEDKVIYHISPNFLPPQLQDNEYYNTTVEINSKTNEYRIFNDTGFKYSFDYNESNLLLEYDKAINCMNNNIANLKFAMNLNNKIINVDNGYVDGFYITNRQPGYHDSFELTIDTKHKNASLGKVIYDSETKNIKSTANYRYEYDDSVKLEDVKIPDLTGYNDITNTAQ